MKKSVLFIILAILSLCIVGSAMADDDGVKIGWAMAYFDHPVYQLHRCWT